MTLADVQIAQGATLAPDNIPLHFGDQRAEYEAALTEVILLDRSHEARLQMTGINALDVMNRISTNNLTQMGTDEGRPTIFTNPNARILDRADVYQRAEDVLVLGEPGRGQALYQYLRRNIFFGDDAQPHLLAESHHQFDLHGPQAHRMIAQLSADAAQISSQRGAAATFGQAAIYIARRKPVSGQRWSVIAPTHDGAALWQALTAAGAKPAGSLVYNALRIRAGLPSVGRELSDQFIPLELGLWDEVSFSKGCYTGQEIIARMESRNRLAKTLVRLRPVQAVDAPAPLYDAQRTIGQLTSSTIAPDGEILALGVVRPEHAQPGTQVYIGDTRIKAEVLERAGIQPER